MLRRLLARLRHPKRLLLAALALLLAPWLLLAVLAALTKLPPELAEARLPSTSVVLRDRHGVVLRELRADDGVRARWLPLAALGDHLPRAVLAAEDRRFFSHPGVDPLSILRAAGQLVVHRRVVSGASTLTQQLARNLVKRPRSLRGKLAEAALAVRIEASLSKDEILEQYLNRVSFGPGLRGIEAASRFYFDKPTKDLSLAEAAALAGIPRGPSVYDPLRGLDRLRRRRDRVLERMREARLAPAAEIDRAEAEPIALAPTGSGLGAPHLVRALMAGELDAALGPLRNRASDLTLTIDRALQRELEVLAADTVGALGKRHVSAASIVVLDNATAEILAYVGSPDIEDAARLGQNDGVLALRQPGSTLKPFVYELAMERLGFTAATVLPDVELILPAKEGDFRPSNYDGRFHGPVRLREALANSYNVPAVWTADALGASRVLARLRDLGMSSLQQDADTYGAAIALGDGEVRLLDLAAAYAALARGGELAQPVAVRAALGKDGASLALPRAAPRRVLDEAASYVITDVLADRAARLASFGEGNVLELPFAAAAKTGTSKGYRDNYTVGFTPEVTVAVWVGNFDGSPMQGVSGVSGAGPLFHDAMLAAMRGRPARDFEPPAARVERLTVCSLSGARPGPACAHTRSELFAHRLDAAPLPECAVHARVRVDRRNGLLAGRACPPEHVEERVAERFDARFTAWARASGRPLAPDAYSPLCPPGPGDLAEVPRGRVRLSYPTDGARFAIDPGGAAQQALRVRADVPPGVTEIRVVVDGRATRVAAPFSFAWPLAPGHHHLRVEADGAGSDEVEIDVE
jgi:penicillin-binding protein 1C